MYIYSNNKLYTLYIYISQRHTGYFKQHGYIDPYKVMPPRFSDGRKKNTSNCSCLSPPCTCTNQMFGGDIHPKFGGQISLSWYMYISHSGWSLPIISHSVSLYPLTSPHYIPWLHRLASHGNFCIQVAPSSAWPRLIVAKHCLEPRGWSLWWWTGVNHHSSSAISVETNGISLNGGSSFLVN